MTFESWLRDVAGQHLQQPASAPPLGAAELARLDKSLRRCMKQNETYFRIAFGLAVILALCAVVLAFVGRGKSETSWMQAGLGVSAFGAVTFAMARVREKQSFDLMIELAVGLDDKAVREVLQVLMKKYIGTGAAPPVQVATQPTRPRTPNAPAPRPPPQSLTTLRPADRPDASPTRASLRSLLESVLLSDPDFDAYCLDYFPSVQKRFTDGMDRTGKLNKLLLEERSGIILDRLAVAYPDRVLSNQHLLQWEDQLGHKQAAAP